MRADGSLEIRFLRVSLPEEVQRPDRARGALEGFVAEAFERHKGRYGYRRIDRELRKSVIAVSGKRVLRTMRKTASRLDPASTRRGRCS